MKNINGKHPDRQVRKTYEQILDRIGTDGDDGFSGHAREHFHQIRACVRIIRGAKREWKRCPVGEYGSIAVIDSVRDLCEMSDYALTQNVLSDGFCEIAASGELTYAEIACLIPAAEYCCLERIAGHTPGNRESAIRAMDSLGVLLSYPSSTLFETLSGTERVLEKDPVFSRSDEDSKAAYRAKIAQISEKKKISERQTAVSLLKTVRTEQKYGIGALLFPEHRSPWYLPLIGLFFAVGLILTGFWTQSVLIPILSAVPLFSAVKFLFDRFLSRILRPEREMKIKISDDNCPSAAVTLVSVLTGRKNAEKLLKQMDILRATVPEQNIRVGLLLDFLASDREETPEETKLLAYLDWEIGIRNRNGENCFCAVRRRRATQAYRFEAFGRKQGALIDFCDLMIGKDDAFRLVSGTVEDFRYLIPLDADTRPAPGSIEGLIGFMEYPGHQPEIRKTDRGTEYVASGYAAATPRIEANPITAYGTAYSRILAGNAGTEFYHQPHFHLYQNLFSEGIFCGKGILRTEEYRRIVSTRFRESPVLSHDLPEGELLRCAAVTDLTFFDDLPENPIAEIRRRNRWLRGDVQNSVFLKKNRETATHFRFKIIDDLIRGTEDLFLFFLWICAALGSVPAAVTALILRFYPAVFALFDVFRSFLRRPLPYRPFAPFFRCCADLGIRFLLLPAYAFSELSGVCLGIIRTVRKKKLLEWTTAAQSGGQKTPGDFFSDLRWQEIGFLFVFSRWTAPIGVLWLIAPLIAYFLSHTPKKKTPESPFLRKRAAELWGYFRDLVSEQTRYLPPDNLQIDPLNTVAHRTSPTNIGLYFLSVIGAHDLKLISEDEMFQRLNDTLTTVETLPKKDGHLFNWYDTQTGKVLPPKFISSVDSGNCAVCFDTVRHALEEFDDERAERLRTRIGKLSDAADFGVFFDPDKDLMTIGIYGDTGEKSDCFYDLYAGEARLTSFYGIMRRQIPLRHWARLARPALCRSGNFHGLSWSGTLFEYFMPHLFLPIFPGSYPEALLKGAVREQIKKADGRPWGVSESGYYAFDGNLNYQYRAFGVPSLAIRRDWDFPWVVSPYSVYLTYALCPQEAEENLRRFPSGKYGYYEAVDFRNGEDNPRTVCSYMAHHIGMSFLSCVNALCDSAIQRRFMKGTGEAYESLLAERVPDPGYVPLPGKISAHPEDPSLSDTVERPDPEHPKVGLLFNDFLADAITDCGTEILLSDGKDVLRRGDGVRMPQGIFLFVRSGGTLIGSTYAPLYDENVSYRSVFENGEMTCYADAGNFETRMTAMVSPDEPVAVRELTVKNNQMTSASFEFFLCLDPCLCATKDYEAHPEYRDLFLKCAYDGEGKTVTFYREGEDPAFLCVTASEKFRFDCRRDAYKTYADLADARCRGETEFPINPGLILRGEIQIRGKGTHSVRFDISVATRREIAEGSLKRVSAISADLLCRRTAQAERARAEDLGITKSDRIVANHILSHAYFGNVTPTVPPKVRNTLSSETFWKYGISGDRPVAAVRVGEGSLPGIRAFLRIAALLAGSGFAVDFAFVYREKESYASPMRNLLNAALETVPETARRYLHAVNVETVEEYAFFQKCATLFFNLERGWKIRDTHRTFRPMLPGSPDGCPSVSVPLGRGGFTKNGTYVLPGDGSAPLRAWSLILANRRFGTVINERSAGWTFSENAAEFPLTPRLESFVYAGSGEPIAVTVRGKTYDALRGGAVEIRPGRMIFRTECGGVHLKTEITVSPGLPAKLFRITAKNETPYPAQISFAPKVVLGKAPPSAVNRTNADGVTLFSDPYRKEFAHETAFLSGNGVNDGKITEELPQGNSRTLRWCLGCGAGKRAALQTAQILSKSERFDREFSKADTAALPDVTVETPDAELNLFFNSFLQQQIIASRLWGRTGPCQPGGAYGFRDQIQDAASLVLTRPELLKQQILRCCRRQFEEGDVMHWWHPASRKLPPAGIRTRFSDDPFWLIYGACVYADATDDRRLFDQEIPYLSAPILSESEADRYFAPSPGKISGTVWDHLMRAFRYGCRIGTHGLILFGSGDWNDGMNRVGDGGETVWGSMFALICLRRLRSLAEQLSRMSEVGELNEAITQLENALNTHAYASDRYLRGYDGNGVPFGVNEKGTCIDLLPQVFSVFAGLDEARQESALRSAEALLCDTDHRLIALLTPPYRGDARGFPGNIAAYPPGVRENGGQYTHAAVWYAVAQFRRNHAESGVGILSMLNPIAHCRTPKDAERYGAEPYVLSGDVYTLPGSEGQAGWSHYTGAAGWYYRTVLWELLGIRRESDRLTVRPCIPAEWNGFKATVRVSDATVTIRCLRGNEIGMYDGETKISAIPLDGKDRQITVIVSNVKTNPLS